MAGNSSRFKATSTLKELVVCDPGRKRKRKNRSFKSDSLDMVISPPVEFIITLTSHKTSIIRVSSFPSEQGDVQVSKNWEINEFNKFLIPNTTAKYLSTAFILNVTLGLFQPSIHSAKFTETHR